MRIWPVILLQLFSGCATTDDYYAGLNQKSLSYQVKRGDTLYGISQRVGRDYRIIAQWNGISDPFRIVEGQTIRLFPPAPPSPPHRAAATAQPIVTEKAAKAEDPAVFKPIKKSVPGGKSPIPVEKKTKPVGEKSAPIGKESDPVVKNSSPNAKESEPIEKQSRATDKNPDAVRKGSDSSPQKSDPPKTKPDPIRKNSGLTEKQSDRVEKKSANAEKWSDPVRKGSETAKKKSDPARKKPDATGEKSRLAGKKSSTNEGKSRPDEKKEELALKLRWRWPLKGGIAKNYSQTSGKGLDISGKFGEAVRAAADGEVVYCGQGLIGYGNLIIVKHDTHYLSAYGNNSRVLVREGEIVKLGQQIAEV
ncbi:MAG: peptidoglycan DD-metalloendopeptidase family protein, partial [Methylococcales bacterium]